MSNIISAVSGKLFTGEYNLAMPLVNPAEWFSLSEAAEYLSLTKARVSVLVREGRIPHERIARMVFIRIADAEAFKSVPRPPGPRTPRAKKHRSRKKK